MTRALGAIRRALGALAVLLVAASSAGCARNMLDREVTFATGDYTFKGQKLSYVEATPVFDPAAKPKTLPVVLFVENDGSTCEAFDEASWQRFLTRYTGDFVFVRPAGFRNVKCGTPDAAGLDFLSRVDELGAVIDRLAEKQRGPLVLLGESSGAQLLPLLAEKKPAAVKALINLGGGVDELSVVVPEAERHKGLPKEQLFRNQTEIERQIERLKGRADSTDPMWDRTERFWHQLFFSGARERWMGVTVPAMIVHGELDEVDVPFELLRPAKREMKRAGKSNVEFVFVEGLGHDLLKEPVMLAVNDWIARELASK